MIDYIGRNLLEKEEIYMEINIIMKLGQNMYSKNSLMCKISEIFVGLF